MKSIVVIFLLILAAPAMAIGNHGIAAPTHVVLDAIPVCYDFACKNNAVVDLPMDEWQEVEGWFSPAAQTPVEERQQIKHAIGWIEVLIGHHTPTHKDLAFDLPAGQKDLSQLFPGQQDCIDEAVNTTTYLRLLEQRGLLRHHTVIEQAYRRAVFDQHWAAQIREIDSGNRYVVDSWFQPNGYLPVIQNSPDWENITFLSAAIDTSRRNEDENSDMDQDYLAGEANHCCSGDNSNSAINGRKQS